MGIVRIQPISEHQEIQRAVDSYVRGKVSTAYDVIVTEVEDLDGGEHTAEFVYKAHTGHGYFTAKVRLNDRMEVVEELEEVK